MTPARRLTRWIVLATSVLAGVTCESPTEPRGVGQRVAAGVTISGRTTPGDAQRYSFLVQQDGEYAVFLAASAGSAQLAVVDSQHVQQLAQLSAGPTSGPLLSNATPDFPATKGTVLLITVGAQTAIDFDFQVYDVNPAPERRAARFSIGDTVAGEDITPVADVDTFVMQGQAGQDIVVVTLPTALVGSGTLILTIKDALTNGAIGFVANDAGSSALHTSGRIRLPSSGDYGFELRGVKGINSNVAPRYQGPYRFWSYAINRAPEHQPATVTPGQIVSGERIDRAGDVDEFSIQAAAAVQYNAFIQAQRLMRLEVGPDSGIPIATALSVATDTTLYGSATGRFTLPPGPTLVRVYGATPIEFADTGSYRVLLYPIDPRPERIAAAILPGDTVSGESIDVPGDVDEFPVPGVAGAEFTVFLQALSGSPQSPRVLSVVDSSETTFASVVSSPGDTSLMHQFSKRFVLPGAGALRLRVSAVSSAAGRDTGSYRFLLASVNRKPERVSDTLVFGDSVLGESIELPNDIDEFQVTILDSSGANLVAQSDSASIGGPLEVTLLDSAGRMVSDLLPFTSGAIERTGPITLGPGKYTVRVQGYAAVSENQSGYVGAYRVWLYKFRFGPETAPDTIQIGDTIGTEGLDVPGDVDAFAVFGHRGDHIDIALQGLTTSGGEEFVAQFGDPGQVPGVFVLSPLLADSLGAYESNRIDLTRTGWYRLAIAGGDGPNQPWERGPYRFAITARGTAPEHVGAALVPGDSVTSEVIDYPGDWDEFTVTGAPGQMVAVVARTHAATNYPLVALFDSSTGAIVGSVVPLTVDRATDAVALPSSGQLQIAVYQPRGLYGVYDFMGDYRFVIVPVNPAPENVPATLALGDTVRGEAIFPATDVDEFTGVAVPGQTLAPWYRLTGPVVPGGEITLRIIDPATGAVLAGGSAAISGSSPDFFSPGQFVVPASGNYILRVSSFSAGDVSTAPYEFFVAPAP